MVIIMLKAKQPIKVKDLLELLKDKNLESDVIDSGIFIQEYFEVSYRPVHSYPIQDMKFETFNEAIKYFTELYEQTKDVQDADFFVIHKGINIYGQTFCELLYAPIKREGILIERRWINEYWKERAKAIHIDQ